MTELSIYWNKQLPSSHTPPPPLLSELLWIWFNNPKHCSGTNLIWSACSWQVAAAGMNEEHVDKIVIAESVKHHKVFLTMRHRPTVISVSLFIHVGMTNANWLSSEIDYCGLVCLLRFGDQKNVAEPHWESQLTISCVCDTGSHFSAWGCECAYSWVYPIVSGEQYPLLLCPVQEKLAAFSQPVFGTISESINYFFISSTFFLYVIYSIVSRWYSCIRFNGWRGVTHRKTDFTFLQWHLVDKEGTLPLGHILQEQ